jgi:hypothetical protein
MKPMNCVVGLSAVTVRRVLVTRVLLAMGFK